MSERWTMENIPDLSGKVIIVTGANSGIGFEAAKAFTRHGGQVILACRVVEKAKRAADQIHSEIPGARTEILQIDLASLESIREFAAAFTAEHDRLDVLLNNAGIMMSPFGKTKDGFEQQFGINHLGHFALTGRLIDLVLNTPDSRVVNVSSTGHRFGSMDFDNLDYDGGTKYSPTKAYGRSKLANLLFTYELQRRFEAAGSSSIAVAVHPGTANTNLTRYLEDKWYYKMVWPLFRWMVQDQTMGALPSIRAAVDPRVTGGQYYGPDGFMEQKGYPVVVESNKASHNEADARHLWEISEQMTGVRFLDS
ncbi:MAG: oxidoreductase [Calditrichota bacterium]